MSRKLLYIGGGIVAVLLLIILILPMFLDANQYRPRIETMMSEALNRKVSIGNISLSIFSGGVSVENLTVADDPAFSKDPFLQARTVTIAVELMPLIFSRQLHVTGLTIDQPQATLLHTASGTWNFSTLGASTPKTSAAPPTSTAPSGGAAALSVQKLNLKNGKVTVGSTGANAKTHQYDQVNLTVSDLSYSTQFPFDLTVHTQGNGTIELKGKAGPLNQTNVQQTPVDAALEVKGLDLMAAGIADVASGLAGVLDFNGTLTSDGHKMDSKGKITAAKLQLVPGAFPAQKSVQVDYDTDYDLMAQSGTLKQGNVQIGKALAQLTGTFRTQDNVTSLQMKLVGKNMPAPDLEAVLPALGIALPAGASLSQGTLNVDMAIAGPLDKLVTSGPVNLSNGKLTGFDLGSKMKALSAFTGLKSGADTVIQTMSADLKVAPDGTHADNFNLVLPDIGSLTGGGIIRPDHGLDFKMAAKLGNASSPLGALASLASVAGGAGQKGGGIPFHIGGTTSNPTFTPDLAGFAGGLGKGAASAPKAVVPAGGDLGQALGGLFGKKK
jgi:AsmA protein